MKPSYTGQRTAPATDQKFRPTDEHLIEKNKEELDSMPNADRKESASRQDRDKFEEVDRKA